MTAMRNVLHLQDFLILLLLLGSSIFFVITSLDSYYIRNLWSFFREVKSGSWQESDPQSETLSSADLETQKAVDDATGIGITADIKSDPIIDAYAHSYDGAKLSEVVDEHQQLLEAKGSELLARGLRICFLAGFPWFASTLSQAALNTDLKVRRFAEKALEINRLFPKMEKYSSVFRRRIKAVALEVLDSSEGEKRIPALKRLIELPNQKNVEDIVAVLADSRFRDLRSDLFSCITRDDVSLTVKPIVEHMYILDYSGAASCRQLLQLLPFGKSSPDLLPIIEAELALIQRDELPLGRPAEEVGRAELHRFMHTLFLEEYRLSPRGSDGAIMDTISEFEFLSPDESAIFIDMHLSFLKRSELFSTWQSLLG